MRRYLVSILVAVAMLGFLVQISTAHVPVFPDDGTTLETAIRLDDPGKSWVIYSELHEAQEPLYYLIEAEAGFRIRVSLTVPTGYLDTPFRPTLVLMGPGLASSGVPPAYLETTPGAGVVVVEASDAQPEYEGFTPTSFLTLSRIDVIADSAGAYYVAVYDAAMGGRYGLVLGYREEFSPSEFILVPFSVIGIHLWEGQSIATIMLPFLVIVSVGSIFLRRQDQRVGSHTSILTWLVRMSAVLFISSGGSIFWQMVLAILQAGANWQVAVTVVFGMLPVLVGIATLRVVRNDAWVSGRHVMARLLLLSVVALLVWAGLVVGPVLLAFTGVASVFANSQGQGNETEAATQ